MKTAAIVSVLTAVGAASMASAGTTYNFYGVTNNNAGDTAIAEKQLTVEVSQSSEFAYFKIVNSGSDDAIVAQVYWDDSLGVLKGGVSTSSSPGVSFDSSTGVKPPVLPGGNAVSFDVDYGIGRTKQGGVHNGINQGEYGNFFIQYSSSFQDVIDAMNSGGLRLGVHVQSFESGGSESLVTQGQPVSAVPTPTAALAGAALLGLCGMRRRRN